MRILATLVVDPARDRSTDRNSDSNNLIGGIDASCAGYVAEPRRRSEVSRRARVCMCVCIRCRRKTYIDDVRREVRKNPHGGISNALSPRLRAVSRRTDESRRGENLPIIEKLAQVQSSRNRWRTRRVMYKTLVPESKSWFYINPASTIELEGSMQKPEM